MKALRRALLILPLLLILVAGYSLWSSHNAHTEPQSPAPIAERQRTKRTVSLPSVCQFPSLPTGCEITAAVTVLQYYGEDIEPETFARDWIVCSEDFYSANNSLYGPDPDKVFVGNPFSTASYGCFAGPVRDAVNAHSAMCHATVLQGETLPDLCKTYIDRKQPVLIWVTAGMKPPGFTNRWLLPDGTSFVWPSGEHCMVLAGYDGDYYYLADPQTGYTAAFDRELTEQRYADLGYRGLLILPRIK